MRPVRKPWVTLYSFWLATAVVAEIHRELRDGKPFGGDFISFWNAAHRARHGDIAAIYDPDMWHRILLNWDTTSSVTLSWFVYPPFTLFGLWLLGDASYDTAVLAWSIVPLVFFFALTVLLARRSGLGFENDPSRENAWSLSQAYAVLFALSLPFLGANLFSGQTGALVAVFFLSAAYFWSTRPVVAGICVGLLSIKPQIGLLMFFALLASSSWRVIVAAAATILTLIVLSVAWLGTSIWMDYFRMSLLFGQFVGSGYDQLRQLALSPYVSLQGAGLPVLLAGFCQAAVSVAVIIVIVQIFRKSTENEQEIQTRDGATDLKFGLLAAGTLLATPYSLSYDSPVLMLSIIPVLSRSWPDDWDLIELTAAAVLLISPYAQLFAAVWHVPFAFVALLVWFGVLYRRFLKERPTAASIKMCNPFAK